MVRTRIPTPPLNSESEVNLLVLALGCRVAQWVRGCGRHEQAPEIDQGRVGQHFCHCICSLLLGVGLVEGDSALGAARLLSPPLSSCAGGSSFAGCT